MKKLLEYISYQYDLATRFPKYAKAYMDQAFGAVMYHLLINNNDQNYEEIDTIWHDYAAKFEEIIFDFW